MAHFGLSLKSRNYTVCILLYLVSLLKSILVKYSRVNLCIYSLFSLWYIYIHVHTHVHTYSERLKLWFCRVLLQHWQSILILSIAVFVFWWQIVYNWDRAESKIVTTYRCWLSLCSVVSPRPFFTHSPHADRLDPFQSWRYYKHCCYDHPFLHVSPEDITA